MQELASTNKKTICSCFIIRSSQGDCFCLVQSISRNDTSPHWGRKSINNRSQSVHRNDTARRPADCRDYHLLLDSPDGARSRQRLLDELRSFLHARPVTSPSLHAAVTCSSMRLLELGYLNPRTRR